MMVGHRGGRREREGRARKRNALLLEELLDAGDIGADDCRFGDHQWLVSIADVVGVEAPLLGRVRLDQEHRLRSLHDHDDGPRLVQDQAVATAQDRAPRKEKTEVEAAVRPAPCAHVQPVIPAERDRVAGVAAGRGRQSVLAMDVLDDNQNRKYRWASGSTPAASLVSSSPSARTSYVSGLTLMAGSASLRTRSRLPIVRQPRTPTNGRVSPDKALDWIPAWLTK